MAEEVIRYGVGGQPILQEFIGESDPEPKKKKETKKAKILEERLHDDLPSDVEPSGDE